MRHRLYDWKMISGNGSCSPKMMDTRDECVDWGLGAGAIIQYSDKAGENNNGPTGTDERRHQQGRGSLRGASTLTKPDGEYKARREERRGGERRESKSSHHWPPEDDGVRIMNLRVNAEPLLGSPNRTASFPSAAAIRTAIR